MGRTMNRETLREYLKNSTLVHIIEQKRIIDRTEKDIRESIMVLESVGISRTSRSEILGKLTEYQKISKGYSNLLEDAWGISWHTEGVIKRYTDYSDGDIDTLPENIKF